MVFIEVWLAAVLMILQVSDCTKIELVNDSVWSTDNEAFTNQSHSRSILSSKLRYYSNFIPRALYIKSIDDRSTPVDCTISNETIESLNIRDFDFFDRARNKSVTTLYIESLIDFGSKVLLSAHRTYDLVIIDPESCSVAGVIHRKNPCLYYIVNPDSFDCFELTLLSEPFAITRYSKKGEVIRSFDFELKFDQMNKIRRLEEPYGDIVYYAWKGYDDDKINLIEFNATYDIIRETYLPITSGHFFLGVTTFDHDKITVCPYVHIDIADYLPVRCKWVDVKDKSKLVKFSFNVTNYREAKDDGWTFGFWDRIYVRNLKRGAFVIYRAPLSSKLYYRYVNDAGAVDDEDQLFYELDEHLDRLHLNVNIYERNGDICVQLHSGGSYIYTKCVKLLL